MLTTRMLGLLTGLLLSFAVAAQDNLLRPDHPSEYVVQQGDTLWDISGMFLREPWYWPEIWYVNPQIDNPHLIFPGDRLVLTYVDGRPILRLQRGKGYVKLSPEVRSSPLDLAIPAIPLEHILPFLSNDYIVLNKDEIDRAPYIVAMKDDRLIGDERTRVYVRSIDTMEDKVFSVFRAGPALKAYGSGEILGYQIVHVGRADLDAPGDPAKVDLKQTNREVLIGDRLLPLNDVELPRNFMPHLPDFDPSARIIAVLDGVSQIGQWGTVVIDRGARDGFEPGHGLMAFSGARPVADNVSGKPGDTVMLPREPIGKLMVYRTFERVSYALVVEATRALHIHDEVGLP